MDAGAEPGEGRPRRGDALGTAFLDALAGRPGPIVIERDDGFVSVDSIDYVGGLDPRDEWAVGRARGRVADVGAGAGRAALALQERGQRVTAIEVSPGGARACRERGVRDVFLGTAEQAAAAGLAGSFDSALLLGNNIGLLGSPEGAGPFLAGLSALLRPGGIIVGTALDAYQTSDAVHLRYHERNRRRGRLPGHTSIRVRYTDIASDWFDWLIPSPDELDALARRAGWLVTELRRGPGARYAVVLGQASSRSSSQPPATSSTAGYSATMASSSHGDQVNPGTGLTAARELPAISSGMSLP
jgi:SAM-dependent methyltransferase